jgi:hypothetical protein
MCDRRAVELKVKLDELDSLKLEHEAMDRMKKRDTEEAQRIDVLKVVSAVGASSQSFLSLNSIADGP